MRMRIGLVTCKVLPEPDPDAAPLGAALTARGHEPILVPWDDDAPAPGAPLDVLVLRSPWNYHERPAAFMRWLEEQARRTRLMNPLPVVRWNIHKRYLVELAAAGAPTVPTDLVSHEGAGAEALERMLEREGDIVIKPAIGAASAGARRFRRGEERDASAWLAHLLTRGDALIQPHLGGFRTPGERSIVWIDGQWTHAVVKRPRFAGEHEYTAAGSSPESREIEVAERALAATPPGVRYARADLVVHRGAVLLSELELIEPSLYFAYAPPAALERFVRAIETP